MALRQSITSSSLICQSCRISILRSFGIEVPRYHSFSRSPGSLSSFRYLSSQKSNIGIEQLKLLAEDSNLTQNKQLPWYLQVQSPRQEFSTPQHLAKRQLLPELPPDSPSILQPLLEYVSSDLGLDYISLLDLRTLDPPPALGSNLIMMIGTARSEKHLHVSADRCCRWLRSNYKLRPHADGLLGRNELKVKLRRKSRRTRLLANVGASPDDANQDDGIRTGWVCVNAGTIQIAPTQKSVEQPDPGFVGFGQESNHVSLVVQMFIEEKRAEIDLESLWTKEKEASTRRAKHRPQTMDNVLHRADPGLQLPLSTEMMDSSRISS